MMETDTRSVAEIIGWERDTHYDEERWFRPGENVAHLPGRGVTVDDMLAWLRDHERFSHEVWYGDNGVVDLRIEYKSTHDHYSAPTLHAALEAAVRAVAADGGR